MQLPLDDFAFLFDNYASIEKSKKQGEES